MASKPGAAEQFRRLTTRTSLTEVFNDYLQDSTAAGRDGTTAELFKRNLANEVRLVNHALRADRYQFGHYRQHLISKGAGKIPRVISIPTMRDKLVLKAIAILIGSLFPEARTELPQTKIARLIAAIESSKFDRYLRVDVREFYPSVPHDFLRAFLKKRIRKPSLLSLVMSSVRTTTLPSGAPKTSEVNSVGVPQGLAVSNILAEICLVDLDEHFESLPHLAYFRYVDDIIVLFNADAEADLIDDLFGRLLTLQLTPHPLGVSNSKSEVGDLADGFDYLGYVLQIPRVSVRNASITKLEASLVKVFTGYKYARKRRRRSNWPQQCVDICEWRLNLVITGCVFDGARRGWLAYFSQIRHHQLLHHFDLHVATLLARFGLQTRFKPKTFVAAYRFAARRRTDTSGYVPNFDKMTSNEQRFILERYFLMEAQTLLRLADVEIARIFHRKIKRLVVELDQDVMSIS